MHPIEPPSAAGKSSATLRAAQVLQGEATARTVLPPLAAARIEAIVLKGPTLAAWLYEPDERRFGDLDLLVSPAQHSAAAELLVGLGYKQRQSGWDALSHAWKRSDTDFAIDLHRSLVGAAAKPELVWLELRQRAVPCEVLNQPSLGLDTVGLAMHTAMHAAQHGATGEEKPLEDLRRAVEVAPKETWLEAVSLARRIDAEAAVAAGLRRIPEGTALADRLNLTADMPLDVALRAADEPPPMVLAIEQLRRTKGTTERARFVASSAFPSPDRMRIVSPIARRGQAGLLAAYALRPVQLLAGLPRGLLRHRRLRQAKPTSDG